MPISPEWMALYPEDWDTISKDIRERAGQKCQWCGVENHTRVRRKGRSVLIVLTVAHLDHDPRNCDQENLRALCQGCHISYDKSPEQQRKREMLRAELLYGQTSLI